MRDMSATELMSRHNIDIGDVSHLADIDTIMDVYRRVGFKDVELVFQGNVLAFDNFVGNNLAPGQSTSFALAFKRDDGTGHVVLMRVWKEPNSNKVNYLTTDFQRPVAHPDRFSQWMPRGARTYYIIHPKQVTYIAENDIANLVDEDVVMSMKEGECRIIATADESSVTWPAGPRSQCPLTKPLDSRTSSTPSYGWTPTEG